MRGKHVLYRWYTRPVFFVADVNCAAHFYVEMLGFEKGWHAGVGNGRSGGTTRFRSTILMAMNFSSLRPRRPNNA
jgi:hypothetical protein